MSGTEIPILPSIRGLAGSCEAWIVDIWGVMHNGARAFETAGDACAKFRQAGGIVLLLSNAPRPFTAVVSQLDGFGVARTAYDAVVTSGDVTRAMIAPWQGRPVLHIGPARDRGLFEGFAVDFADALVAEVIVCSGLFDDSKQTPQDYAELFAGLVARRVPMICANPDLMVERGDKLVYCAGALAAEYAAIGGEVSYAGKPHWPVYARALTAIDARKGRSVAKDKVLAIGDGIETDLRGAYVAGLRSVFIASAIHAPEGLSPAMLQQLFRSRPFAPVAALAALTW
ncbi:MAG TPA: TIGR01459 family HAD-type hydrolase [Hyphomicrobiaceae bacterium]|jgi:HAD superfamily hydrolase (TIGR01459 family)|nr:TIGR01459 family HAD-type hydrolase [Hyphomicrobiaceae bacterium]